MPLYEIFCLTRPTLTKPELLELIKRSCSTVYQGQGVVTKVVSNGNITLAHKIKKTHGHYEEVSNSVMQVASHNA